MFSIYKPVNKRDYKKADYESHHHGAYHGHRKRALHFRTEVGGKQQRNHCEHRSQCGHDDSPEPSVTGRMYGIKQGHAFPAQLIDGIKFQDGVIHHDTTGSWYVP